MRRTVRDSLADRLPGLAAEMAFYFLLSVPPLLVAVLGSAGYVGQLFGVRAAATLLEQLLQAGQTVFTAETMQEVVAPMLRSLLEEGRVDVASFGIVLTVWSASRAMNVLLSAITIAYDLEHARRAGWKRRMIALGLTIVAVVGGMVVIPLLVGGPRLAEALTRPLGMAEALAAIWQVAYWPTVGAIATLLLASLYHFGAPWSTPWRRDLPGAVLAMLAWLMGSIGLRFYTSLTIEADVAYQHIAAPLVVLLWLYVIGFALLLGAEFNAEIEKMWPTRRPPEHGSANDDARHHHRNARERPSQRLGDGP